MDAGPVTTEERHPVVGSVLNRLPPFPAALATVMHACADDGSSVAEIARAVAMEEVLAAKVVRAANSAALGAVQAADNVVTAVGRLGSSSVRGLAIANFLTTSFSSAFSHAGLNRKSLWFHNLAVAAASSGVAGTAAERSNAYFAGLVHDVGKMVLAAELGPRYADCLAEAALRGVELSEVERKQVGVDHAEIGAEAAQSWHFAAEVVEAIRLHHDVLGASLGGALATHVVVGNQVAKAMGYTTTTDYSGPPQVSESEELMLAGISQGIMSRARWALTRDLGRIEAIIRSTDL